MEISLEDIRKLVYCQPGNVVVYHLKDGIHRLCYTDSVAALCGYTVEEYNALHQREATDLIHEDDRASVLAALMKGVTTNTEISCTYRIVTKNGSTTRVQARARVIGELDGAPVVLNTLMSFTLDSLQYDLINRIPVGMGIYEVFGSDTPSLKYLNDSYYEMMGFERNDRTRFLGDRTIEALHPDDRHLIVDGIRASLENDSEFNVTVRMMGLNEGDYHWLLLNSKVAEHTGQHATFYVSFTLVDHLMAIQEELEKSRAVLKNAVDSINLRYFEYYPGLKLAIEHDKENLFDLPSRFENYPEDFFALKMIHPQEEGALKEAFHAIDTGAATKMDWDGRARVGGRYVWYHLNMTALPQGSGERVVLCTLNDITLIKEAMQAYRGHIDSIFRMNPDAISSIQLNLTDNTCPQGHSRYRNILDLVESATAEELFETAALRIPDAEDRARFLDMFDRSNMLERFEKGESRFQLDHRYQIDFGRIEWLQTNVDLIRNPFTGDVEATLYTLNINLGHVEKTVVSGLMQSAYDVIGVISLDTDEFFLFDRERNALGDHHMDFPSANETLLRTHMTEKEWNRKKDAVAFDTIRAHLDTEDRYDVTFFSQTEEGLKRKQVSYFFVNRDRGTILATIRDFTDKNLLERFRFASRHDPVTGLYNRATTFDQCRHILELYPDEQFVMCHFDIQKFRLLNSFYGEETGDAVLVGLAQVFENLARDYECSAYGRVDADIFCMCYPLRDELMRKDIKTVRDWLSTYMDDFYLEGRFGIYPITDRTLPVEAMFARAAVAANHVNSATGSNHKMYDQQMEDELQREQRITNEMKGAIKNNQFKVYLQPKMNLDDERPCGAEALVRWEHPTHGLISPNDFIPLFEKNGFITHLDHYMWESVCKLLRRWIDDGFTPYPVSVNVSRVSMYSPTTVGYLCELVERYRLPAHLLELELTESAYMDDPTEMRARVEQLRGAGFSILMDDFGSGYSSLNTLRDLPVDILKLDTEFLSAAEDERSQLVLSSVVSMAHDLNLPVVVEGVETPAQRDFLRSIGCHIAQGYLFARPMPAERYEQAMMFAS